VSASRRDRRDSIAESRYGPGEIAAGRTAIAELTLFVIAPARRPGSRKRGRGGRQGEGERRGYAYQNRHTAPTDVKRQSLILIPSPALMPSRHTAFAQRDRASRSLLGPIPAGLLPGAGGHQTPHERGEPNG
jgi:hypothetical protein